jgi:tetratricopeptide (TPR) repeat protein
MPPKPPPLMLSDLTTQYNNSLTLPYGSKEWLRILSTLYNRMDQRFLKPLPEGQPTTYAHVIARKVLLDLCTYRVEFPGADIDDNLSIPPVRVLLSVLRSLVDTLEDEGMHRDACRLESIHICNLCEDMWNGREEGGDGDMKYIEERDWMDAWEKKIREGLRKAQQAIDLAKKKHVLTHDTGRRELMKCLLSAGIICLNWALLDDDYNAKSLEYFSAGLEIANAESDDSYQYKFLCNEGVVLRNSKDYTRAVDKFNQALQMKIGMKDYGEMMAMRKELFKCYLLIPNVREAREMIERMKIDINRIDADERPSLDLFQADYDNLCSLIKELNTLVYRGGEEGVYRRMGDMGGEDIQRMVEVAGNSNRVKIILSAIVDNYRDNGDREYPPGYYDTGGGDTGKEKRIGKLNKLTVTRPYMPIFPPASLFAHPLRYISPFHHFLSHILTLANSTSILEVVVNAFKINNYYKRYSLSALYTLLHRTVQAYLEDEVSIGEYVTAYIDYANVLEDLLEKREGGRLNEMVETEFNKALNICIKEHNIKLVGLVLVNLEIVYRKWKDDIMIPRIKAAIDKFKIDRDCDGIVINVEPRRGIVQVGSGEKMVRGDGDSVSKVVYPSFEPDFKSNTNAVQMNNRIIRSEPISSENSNSLHSHLQALHPSKPLPPTKISPGFHFGPPSPVNSITGAHITNK